MSRVLGTTVLIAILVGLSLNVRFAQGYGDALAVYNLGIDSATYDQLATEFAKHPRVGALRSDQPPGFVAGLGLAYRVGFTRLGVKMVFCALVAIMAVLVWWLGSLYSPAAGAVAAGLVTFSPLLRAYAATIQYEIPAAFLLTLASCVTVRAGEPSPPRRTLLLCSFGALVCAVAALTPEVLVISFPVLLVHVARRRRDLSASTRRAVLGSMLAMYAVLVGGWVLHQSIAEGRLVAISDKGAVNFQIGNNPRANGTYNFTTAPPEEPSGWAFIRSRPATALRLAGRKALYFAGMLKDGWNVPRPAALYLSRAALQVVPLDWWLVLARGGAVSLLALGGALILSRSSAVRHRWWPLPATIGLLLLVHLITMSSHCFAVPAWPLITVLAAVPLAQACQWVARWPVPALTALAVVGPWSIYAQTWHLPGRYTRPVTELGGERVDHVADVMSPRGHVIYASAAGGRRVIAVEPTEFIGRGFFLVVLGLRTDTLPTGMAMDTPVADIVVSDERGRELCSSGVAASWFSSPGYRRIPARCELPDDGVVSVAVWTTATANVWLDEFSLRFGHATRDDAVIPDSGPRPAR